MIVTKLPTGAIRVSGTQCRVAHRRSDYQKKTNQAFTEAFSKATKSEQLKHQSARDICDVEILKEMH